MPKIIFITPAGSKVEVEGDYENAMEAAVDHDIEGIEAQCGGVCSCATCHVRVHPDWVDRVGTADEIEQDMLDLYENADGRSRLSCQIECTEELDGLVLEVSPLDF